MLIPGNLDAKLDVIPEEGSSVTTPLPSGACSLKSEEGATLKVPLLDDQRLSESDAFNPKAFKKQKPSSSRSQPVDPHAERSRRTKRDPSPTPSSSSETSSLPEQATGATSRPPPPPCSMGEKVSCWLHVVSDSLHLSLSLSLSHTHTHTHCR